MYNYVCYLSFVNSTILADKCIGFRTY